MAGENLYCTSEPHIEEDGEPNQAEEGVVKTLLRYGQLVDDDTEHDWPKSQHPDAGRQVDGKNAVNPVPGGGMEDAVEHACK